MALSISITGTTIKITGNTYDHKEYFKSLGGKWDSKTKSWMIPNAETNKKNINEYINKHKKIRRCGFCGKPGHNRTKCVAYAKKQKEDAIKLAEAARRNPPRKFEMLKHTPYCDCNYVPYNYNKEEVGLVPNVCNRCFLWCCAKATPHPKMPNNQFEYTCPCHGSSMENLLNDTRGT
jgi:hypothetical protein